MAKSENCCTWSPDWVFGNYIGDCCKEHDKEYRKDSKTITRKEADQKFLRCLKSKLPKYLWLVAYLYYFMVRFISKPGWERWKYHWFLGIFAIRRKNEN